MRKIVLLLCLICFSCKETDYNSNDFFLEFLKENSDYFEKNSKEFSEVYGRQSKGIDGFEEYVLQHNLVKSEIDTFFKEIVKKDKSEKIHLQEEFVKKINALKVKIKLPKLDKQKLEVLTNDQLYFYIKASFYKNVEYGYSQIRFPCR
ncbi:hypothetical protein [Flavobacterium terrae]|uniref:Uncharacterized protein n=1 Tax=Flavobacterium terrae TaxID=415425 RepID=A0A1M6D0U6_9FLAO|nr:hypothetical protein [Flavobacterium terrae]SHI66731.1 hypothetical protein SAMN05444363_1191 [Flavobacterium terrae]